MPFSSDWGQSDWESLAERRRACVEGHWSLDSGDSSSSLKLCNLHWSCSGSAASIATIDSPRIEQQCGYSTVAAVLPQEPLRLQIRIFLRFSDGIFATMQPHAGPIKGLPSLVTVSYCVLVVSHDFLRYTVWALKGSRFCCESAAYIISLRLKYSDCYSGDQW